MNKICYSLVLLLLAACTSQQQKATARITERKAGGNGKLLVHYTFQNEGKTIRDSAEILGTKVLPDDTVPVFFSVKQPVKSNLQLP